MYTETEEIKTADLSLSGLKGLKHTQRDIEIEPERKETYRAREKGDIQTDIQSQRVRRQKEKPILSNPCRTYRVTRAGNDEFKFNC